MKKAILFSVVLVLFASSAFAQDVPDLSKDWKLAGEQNVQFGATMPDGTVVPVQALAKYFHNEGNDSWVSVLVWDGGAEVAMMFEDNAKTLWMALRVGDKWYRAKESGFVLRAVVVMNTNNEPTGVKLSMDTVDGEKELSLPS